VKLAFVTAFPEDPAAPRGGVEAVSVVLIDALLRLGGLDVHVVTLTRDGAGRTEAWRGATIHRLPRLGRWTLTGAVGADRRQVTAFLLALAPDVVHANDTYRLIDQGPPLPRVFTRARYIHADTQLAGGPAARARAAVWRRLETRGWADQPHIISISPYVRERLRGIANGVIHDIENPVARSFFDIERRETRAAIFSAGAICRRKNTLALIDAFAALRSSGVDAMLRLAGNVTEADYGARVRERIAAADVAGHVNLLGAIPASQIASELSAASVFALVSLEENSPLGVQEAMAAGVPVVTSSRCGMPYLVRDGQTGFLVDPHDRDDIASRLREIVQDASLRAAMGAAARAFALERFHPDVVARRTRDVYARAAARSRGIVSSGR
jgi:glycosyltransferase involved in cell wall biosynthesis